MPRSSFMYLFKKQQLNFITELDKIRGIYFDRLKKPYLLIQRKKPESMEKVNGRR